MNISSKEIFIVYELGHIEEAHKRMHNGALIVCLDFLVEQECKKNNIQCISLYDIVEKGQGEERWWELSHEISREWYRLPAMKFFQYNDIRVAEAPEPIMQACLARLFYYVRVFIALKKKYPHSKIYIPDPTTNHKSFKVCLEQFVPWAVINAGRMVGFERGEGVSRITSLPYDLFPHASLKTFLMRLHNMFIGFTPRRKFKIYATAYWTHAAPIIPYMKDVECMLIERRKIMDIPLRVRFYHRIRVFYPHGVVSSRIKFKAQQAGKAFMSQWQHAKHDIIIYFKGIEENLDWTPVLEICESIVRYAPRVVADIEMLKQTMEKEKPDVVLQMASVGGPEHYFFLMARVASQLKIPSVELQHATVTIDPRSVFCRIETDYLATYGKHINELHEKLGNERNRLISVGSPRFDEYIVDRMQGIERGKEIFRKIGFDTNRPILFIAVPFSDTYATAVDSYELFDLFQAIRLFQDQVPGIQLFFKCRNERFVAVTQTYLKELFEKDWAVSANEDIFPLLCASDAVITSNSTIIYHAILAQKPLILHPWKRFDSYHAQIYESFIPLIYDEEEAMRALARIFTDVLYRNELLLRQKSFLENYSFDGKSVERAVALLRTLAQKKRI